MALRKETLEMLERLPPEERKKVISAVAKALTLKLVEARRLKKL